MSLETLLEAAEFLESKKWRTPPKARGEESSQDFHHYAKTSSIDDNGDSSLDSSHGQGGAGDDFRDKRRYGGAGTREVHNKLEKNRRAHLKECFEVLKKQIPFMEDKKTSNLSILRGSLKYIQNLKRKEKEYEMELQRLAQEKSRLRDRIATLKMELAEMNIEVDLVQWMHSQEQETNSTSTATEGRSPIVSDAEDDGEEEDESPTLQRIAPKAAMMNSAVKSLPLGMYKNMPSGKASSAGHHSSPVTTAAPAAVPPPVAPRPPMVRPPVTQILHDTLTQRQALQKQALAASQAARAASQMNMKQPVTSLRQPFAISNLAPSTTSVNPGGHTGSGKLMTATVNIPNISKALGHPLLVAATALGSSGISNAAGSSSAILNHLNSVKNPLPSVITTLAPPTVSTVTTVPTIKPIFATSPAHLVPGQLTFNPLIAGALPKTTGQVLSTVGSIPAGTILTSSQTQVTSMPHIMSLAHMGLNNMTVMSPGMPVANLASNQLNNVLSQQAILKQIPLLQPHILQSGQMIGTPVVKPVVMVSMPSVATTTTPAVQVTHSTS
ncbi:max-binding protein MNT-like isoform X1 [Haliotis cracherodii]|uniref:max-binding protein MNT-like isoform X1 n=2 Tax=Haliotis cracherodii TaxID=6455 RepID=UPI0039E87D33